MTSPIRLRLEALSVSAVALSFAPSVSIRLGVSCEGVSTVHALMLRARIRVHASGRSYSAQERARLTPLFGEPSQWARTTTMPVAWAEASVSTGRFESKTELELVVPCSYDLTLATTKLFDALDGGTLPISIVFSGTLFCEDESGSLRVQPVPTDEEARVDLSIETWRALMEAHHPDGALVTLPRALADRLRRCGERRGDRTGGSTLERIIAKLVEADEHQAPSEEKSA